MKYTIALFISAVTAEDGVACEWALGDRNGWTSVDLIADDADTCYAACVTSIGDGVRDYCCGAKWVGDALDECKLYDLDPEMDEDARNEVGNIDSDLEVVDGTVWSAWGWLSGVALEDIIIEVEEEVVEEEEDEEENEEELSVRMTTSALAAAAVAMLAM